MPLSASTQKTARRRLYAPGTRRRLAALRALTKDPTQFFERQAREHGDVSGFRFGKFQSILLNHPDLIRNFLVNDARHFSKVEGSPRTQHRFGQGLLTSEGDFHLRQRRLMQPVFLKNHIENYAEVMGRRAQNMSVRWEDGQEVDMMREMIRLALAVVSECLFSVDVEGEAHVIFEALDRSIQAFNNCTPLMASVLAALPVGPSRELQEAQDKLDVTVQQIIQDRRSSGEDTGDLLSLLLQARYDDGSAMDDRLLRDEVMTLFLAGHETTANTLAWTWLLLAHHPEVEARLVQEAQSVLRGRSGALEDYERLTFTRQVISESMRVYPPAWIIGRQAKQDYKIEHEGRTYLAPKDSIVLVSQWVMHRDPRFWEEPEVFRPERWAPGAEGDRPKFAYFPFGAGPRFCIAEGFAWMEAVLALATLAQTWKAVPVPGARIVKRPGITLRPVGLRMRLERREFNASV